MDETTRRARIERFLNENGLAAAASTLRYDYQRERSDVWSAALVGPAGDASMEIFVYDLDADPANVVDFEEELVALRELGRVQPREIVPELIADGSADGLAILLAAAPGAAAAVRRFLSSTEPPPGEAWLTYHPQLDRLRGADRAAELNGRIIVAWLMSDRRMRLLVPLMQQLAEAVAENTVPVPMVTFSVELADEEIFSLGSVPGEYDELAMLQAVLPPGEPLGVRPRLPADASADLLAEQMFTTLAAAHAMPATLARGAGCCLRGEFVTARGALLDAYFLTGADEVDAAVLERGRLTDVASALQLLSEATPAVPALDAAMRTAIRAYLTPSALAGLLPLVEPAAHTAGEPLDEVIDEPLVVLAAAMRRAAPR